MRWNRTRFVGAALGSLFCACAPEGSGSAFVSFNIKLDEMCVASSSAEEFLPQGVFDIHAAAVPGCMRAYRVNLRVHSNLRENADEAVGRTEPNFLQIHSAEVKLTTIQDQTIVFESDPPLPNPFLVTSNTTLEPRSGTMATESIASLEAIPAAYAPYLSDFVDGLIRAKIQLFGTTTGDVDVETLPFTYPIEICDGCLTRCIEDFDADVTVDDVNMGECKIGGVDGRVCVEVCDKKAE